MISSGARRSASVPAPRRLGIGVLYNPSLVNVLRGHRDSYDYVEIVPDMFWTDRGPEVEPRYVDLPSWVRHLDEVAKETPLVAHSLGFSIGSAGEFDPAPVNRIREWHQRYDFVWHSDHLSFVRTTGFDGYVHDTGLAMPVPYDEEMLDLVAERVEFVLDTVPLEFLLENSVSFVDISDCDMTEPDFLNRLHARTGCGILLDLHNLYTNARNHGFDATEFLGELNLDAVVEVHIAGGTELGGMWTDSHAGPVTEPVWDLLDHALPRMRNLRGLTYEFSDSYFPLMGDEGVLAQLERARTVWERVCTGQ